MAKRKYKRLHYEDRQTIEAMDKKKAGNSERTAGGRQTDKAYRAGIRI